MRELRPKVPSRGIQPQKAHEELQSEPRRDVRAPAVVWFLNCASSCSILAFSASSPLIASSTSRLFCMMKPPWNFEFNGCGVLLGPTLPDPIPCEGVSEILEKIAAADLCSG